MCNGSVAWWSWLVSGWKTQWAHLFISPPPQISGLVRPGTLQSTTLKPKYMSDHLSGTEHFGGLTETPETAFVVDTFGELVVLFLAVCQLEVGRVSTTQAPPSQCLPHMRVTPVRGLTSICLLTMAE